MRGPTPPPSPSTLPQAEAAPAVFGTPPGSLLVLCGITGGVLRELVDQTGCGPEDRRVLFIRLQPAASVAAHVEQALALLAEAARRLWPVWFTDVSFAMCGNDSLGRQAAGVIAREAAARVPGVNTAWAEPAARLALNGLAPRVASIQPAIELAQLSLAIGRTGLVVVADMSTVGTDARNAAALVHALEAIARHSHAGVVALFAEWPAFEQPFERILYGARWVAAPDGETAPQAEGDRAAEDSDTGPWLAPPRGSPHPMSEIEQRLYAMLGCDSELAALFQFNCSVVTVRGSRFRGDLVWTDGRLVVELDGYPDHSTRPAFRGDRHRDYELTLSGYTVLRIANDEIVQDYERAIEKIRDLVRWRRSQMIQEA